MSSAVYSDGQLGNTRLSFSDAGSLVQEDHYYPFGMKLAGDIGFTGSSENKFLYNGKELEDDLGLYWYHYGARYYDPQLGRWHVVDPVDEFHSPYQYGPNNPINNGIDPNGMFWDEITSWWNDFWGFSTDDSPGDYWAQSMAERNAQQEVSEMNSRFKFMDDLVSGNISQPECPNWMSKSSFIALDNGPRIDTFGKFRVSEYELMKENIQLTLPIVTTAVMIAYPITRLGLFARVGTSASRFGQGMSWFSLRQKHVIQGVFDALPGFPAPIPTWKYFWGFVGSYTAYEFTK